MTKHISISPCASSFYHNEEAAPVGEALTAVNLRRRCQSVEVVGNPEKVGEVPAGHRIICLHNGEYVTTLDGNLYYHGTAFHHSDAEVLEAHSIEQFLVVNTSDGVLYFTGIGSKLARLDPADAMPELHLTAIDAGTVSESLPPYSFSSPLTDWRTPLAAADISALAATMRSAYQHLQNQAKGADAYSRPILARYAVRTFADQYLWISAPVLIGHDCVKSNYRTQTEAVASGSQYTGIGSAAVELPIYKLGVSVVSAPAAEWRRLIKSVDIFVTDETDTADTALLDYRIATTSVGTRKYIAEFGPAPRNQSAIADELMAYRWHMVASCASIASLADHEFKAWGASKSPTTVLPGIAAFTLRRSAAFAHTLTPEDCAAIAQGCSTEHLPACTMMNGGRLYMGGGGERLKAAWKPSVLFAGTYTNQPCTVWLTQQLSTEQGDATIVSAHSYPFTPSAINPLVCTPHGTATALRIEVITEQNGVTAWEGNLTPADACGLSATYTANLQPAPLTAATATHGAVHTAVVAAHGLLTVSHIAQPLVREFCHAVTGAEILALAATERPIYSGGFGRHPLYVFTKQGIYVVPQASSGAFGEAKLMSRKAIDAHTRPASGGGKVWFVSAHRQLCAIEGSKVEVVVPQWQAATLAWNDAEHELWSLQAGGSLYIADADGFFSQLTLGVHSLYYDGESALAVTPDGSVLNICSSVATEQQVKYVSHPVRLSPDMRQQVEKIIWKVFGSDQHLRLSLLGERGESLGGFNICSVKVDGNICSPIALPVIFPAARTVRLQVEGTSTAGTLIYGADLYINTHRHL